MTETQQRFLRAIAERVAVDRIVELHLFPAIRQGGVETGVAVVAEQPLEPGPAIDDAGTDPRNDVVEVAAEGAEPTPGAETEALPESTVESADEPGDVELDAVVADTAEAASLAEDSGETLPGSVPAPPERLIIHTASYRLTLKGVDRGKWEVDVVAEADAPLHAVDAVVRGVQRRAGEGAEPDRLSTDALREALEAPLATLER